MIKIENVEVNGWEAAIRGMRNPMNSWDKSDSKFCQSLYSVCDDCPHNVDGEGCPGTDYYNDLSNMCGYVGPNDLELMNKLANGGPVHAKYRRMITVYVDITAPLYWWKEFDTYKVGTVANSCSTMHKIHAKEFTLDDFSHEHLVNEGNTHAKLSVGPFDELLHPLDTLKIIIAVLNSNRNMFLQTNDKKYWWQMIQLLPSSYNQKRTVLLNYEVLSAMYYWRKDHKLDEWREFCKWIESLPYSEIITGGLKGEEKSDQQKT